MEVGLGTDTKLVFNNLGGLGPKTTDAQPVIRATNVLWATIAVSDPDLLPAIRFLHPDAQLNVAFDVGIDL